MNHIDEQKANTLEFVYAMSASLGAVGIVAGFLALFIRSLACC